MQKTMVNSRHDNKKGLETRGMTYKLYLSVVFPNLLSLPE